MADSVWRGSRPFVRWAAICTQMAFDGTQVWQVQVLHVAGPNYVKLSRVFAVQLFGVIIEHYAALPPVRSDPHWSHSHAIIASIGPPGSPRGPRRKAGPDWGGPPRCNPCFLPSFGCSQLRGCG
jgi:hypothetical protein